MAQRIGLISDTQSYLDERVLHYFEDCDQIWHAGDIGSLTVSEKLASLKPFKAVFGNIDDKSIQAIYPENLIFNVEEKKILITHIGGRPDKYPTRVKELLKLEKPDIYICGHSHILMVHSDHKWNNMLFINPGAAGNEGFHKIRTIMKFDLNAGKIENMKVIELGKRGGY
jgi:putative phosphoesterase